MRLAAVLLCLLVIPSSIGAAEISKQETLALAVDGYIRPAFAELHEKALTLGEATSWMCDAAGPAELDAARVAFKEVVLSFSRVEFLRFGPLTEDSRMERLLFWPDRKGIALRQVQTILATEDAAATSLADLQQKSIAVQGLGALDYALFGEGSEVLSSGRPSFRCDYADTVAAAVAETTGDLSEAWAAEDGIAAHIAAPDPAYVDYRSSREALEELVGSLAHGIETIRDTRLLPFIGRDGERPKPKSALFWRSDMTMPAIRAGFAGIRDMLVAARFGDSADADDLWVGNSVTFELGNALRAADRVTAPVAEALDDPDQRKALDYLVILTGSLQDLLGESLPAALGLSVGFSSLDGD